jgi:mannose/cellobiose epimerase-like protein (N-acyl-D-glucosamine 2-epimerase family)
MKLITQIMIDEFYNADENLFFLSANSPDDVSKANAATDFGHTIKAIWMIYNVGVLLEDQELIDFAMQAGPGVLEQAYIVEEGTWANGVLAGGTRADDKDWWVYNELNQFSMTFGLQDEAIEAYLPMTTDYFFQYFVDHEYGEIWTMVDGKTNQPKAGALPKAWPWKSAYHSFEHALIGYITGSQMADQPVTLYYAFVEDTDVIHPYFFQGDILSQEVTQTGEFDVVKVVFEGIR